MVKIPRPTELRPDAILFEDNHCLAVSKPPRLLVAADRTGDPNLLDLAREYIRRKYQKPGNVFLGLVHRLDRPVSGIVLFARTSKAAARLSEQFRERRVEKVYRALVPASGASPSGTLKDWLLKDTATNTVRCVPAHTPEAKPAVLHYRRVRAGREWAEVEIHLETGRSHQIRVQLAAHGMPICGDRKYGSAVALPGAIALHASKLNFEHPTRREPITITAPPPAFWSQL